MEFKDFNWRTMSFVAFEHLALFIALPIYLATTTPSIGLLSISFILYFICGVAVTAGYHRYYAHKAFKLNKHAEKVLLYFSTLALASSVLKWANDHRIHHRYVDTDKDPYSIKKGFWYAHFWWMSEKERPIDKELVHDLLKNKWLVLQDKYYFASVGITNIPMMLFVGWLTKDLFGAIVISFLARTVILHHSMWFVNSLAHYWGKRPFSKEHTAVNSWMVALFTFGEGYHNFHHTFASDYRNGVRWYQYDPTKATIWVLEKLGLATQLKRTRWITIKKAMAREDKRLLLKKVRQLNWTELEKEVHARYERYYNAMAEYYKLYQDYKAMKRKKAEKSTLTSLKLKLKSLRKSTKLEYKDWNKFNNMIHKMKVNAA